MQIFRSITNGVQVGESLRYLADRNISSNFWTCKGSKCAVERWTPYSKQQTNRKRRIVTVAGFSNTRNRSIDRSDDFILVDRVQIDKCSLFSFFFFVVFSVRTIVTIIRVPVPGRRRQLVKYLAVSSFLGEGKTCVQIFS